MRHLSVLLCTVAVLTPTLSIADMFDRARQAVRTDIGRADTSGVTVRGGAHLTTGLSPSSATLLRGHASVGGGCGAFDFTAALREAFAEIPELFEALVGNLGSAAPMLVLCYTSPSLCDVYKHFQSLVNVVIQARYANCQAVQSAAQYGGLRLRGGAVSQCLEDQVQAGTPISEALRVCNGSIRGVRSPGGVQAPTVALVQETLDAAGASTEMRQLAQALLGDITLSTNNGQLGTRQERPQAALMQRYEGHRHASNAAVRAAVEELAATGQVSETTLRELSVPGQPMPRAALDALVALQQDPVRAESLTQKLTTGLAITRLSWECNELQEQLAGSIEANQHLTDEQKRLLEKRLEGLQRDLQQVMQRKEVVERHLHPAIDALLHEYAGVQEVAKQAGLRAPGRVVPAMPFRQQGPAGYGY